MQQATGHDFGITFLYKPDVPEGTLEKILSWWEAEGKKLFKSQ